MSARWMTLGVWALVAAAAVAWGLRLVVKPLPVPAGTPVADATPVLQGDLTRLLGTDPPPPAVTEAAPPPPDARFTLLGVVAPRTVAGARSREGVALIAVDDQPPRAYRVGARVDGETVLQAVNARGAELGPRGGPVRVALELPPPAPPAVGTLPGVGQPAGAAVSRPPAPVPPFARPGTPPRAMPQRTPYIPQLNAPQNKFQSQPANPRPDEDASQPENPGPRNTNPTLM